LPDLKRELIKKALRVPSSGDDKRREELALFALFPLPFSLPFSSSSTLS
jgi:hypothetical protein